MQKQGLRLALVTVLLFAIGAWAGSDSRLGVGANYWTTVKNIDVKNVDEHGFSWVGSYQYWPSLLGLEADVEWFPSGYAGAGHDVFAPQAYLIVGRTIYGAAGIGGYYSDGTWGNRPFYALRVGLNLELLPHVYVDLNANYRFEDWSNLNSADVNSDTVTLGAAARLAF